MTHAGPGTRTWQIKGEGALPAPLSRALKRALSQERALGLFKKMGDDTHRQWNACLLSRSGGLRALDKLCVEPAGLCGRCTGVAVPLRVVPSPTGLQRGSTLWEKRE